VLEIFEEHEECTFYTVRKIEDGEEINQSETQLFFEKFYNNEGYRECIKEIISLLDYIGEKRGAHPYLFRHEGKAVGLPKNEHRACKDLCLDFANFPLRLFCLRITDQILVLFNGGIKDADKAQDTKASMSFQEAQQFCIRIDRAISEQEIKIDGMFIVGQSVELEEIEL